MYENAQMTPVETTPGMEGGSRKRAVEGVNSNVIYLIHCKNFCKCHSVLLPSTTIKILFKKLSLFIN
jgi:hypothetical protein